MKIGDRVFITDLNHPWNGYAGSVVSGEETYGLGWNGFRVKVDETCGQETYVTPSQVTPTPLRSNTRHGKASSKRV